LQENYDKMLEDLGHFVERETPSDDKARLDDFAEFLAEYGENSGGTAEMVPMESAGNHLRITWGDPETEPPILLIGHFDTVWPVGTLERMPYKIENGIARGPGVFDMKGGLLQGFWALRALREQGGPTRPVVFVCNSDEEVQSTSSRELIEWEATKARAALVLESSDDGLLTTARKGVGTFRLRVIGEETHAGVDPFGGISAIEELARLTLKLHEQSDPQTGTTVNVGVVSGGTRPNVVAGEALAEITVRVVTESESRRMSELMFDLQPEHEGAHIEVTGGIKRPPMQRGEATASLFDRAREVASGMGHELNETMSGGGSDGNLCASVGAPVLDSLGAVGGGAHSTSEHIRVDTMPWRSALVSRLIEEV
jgi:glutamate carboxypeptidase